MALGLGVAAGVTSGVERRAAGRVLAVPQSDGTLACLSFCRQAAVP